MTILLGPQFVDAHGACADHLGCHDGRYFVADGPQRTLPGAFAVPGLTDSHLHLMGMGWVIDQVDLMGCDSVEEVRQRLARWVQENPDAPVVRGRSWNHTRFPGQRLPTAADLAGLTDKPIYLTRQDGHACWVDQRLLDQAQIADVADPFGGLIVRDQRGVATGILVDTAMPLAACHLPKPTAAQVRRWLDEALRRCVAAGLTAVHDVDVPLESFLELERLDAQGRGCPSGCIVISGIPRRAGGSSRSEGFVGRAPGAAQPHGDQVFRRRRAGLARSRDALRLLQ